MQQDSQTIISEAPVKIAGNTCYHCGETCSQDTITADEHSFCCDGCYHVYDLLKVTELCDYYAIDGPAGVSPDKSFFAGKFDYLDLPEVSSKILEFTDGHLSQVSWYIPKMHCSSCIWLLEQLYKFNPAIRSSVVNFPEKKVRITFESEKVRPSELATLISGLGYEPYISLNDMTGQQQKKWNRIRLYKIGVAGFCFGNVMMLSFPEYFHLGKDTFDESLRSVFGWLNLALSIPVLLYCASDFFKSAWAALKGKYLNIDAPIVIALLSIFSLSLYQILSATGPGYFDSLTGAVFFMLTGRFFQDKTYAGISFDRDYRSYFPVAVSVLTGKAEIRTPVTDLKAADIILVRNAELIPTDSVLLSQEALIDYSFVSGEAEPVRRIKGDTIYAGGKQTGPAIELEIVRKVSQSYLTQLWNNESFSKQKEDQNQMLAARINRYFSVIVLIIAMLTFSVWYFILKSPETAFRAFTTCLLVACPCGLLFSSTFTNGNLMALFGKNQCYPKNADAIERLSKVDTVVFDKTGTITRSDDAEVAFFGTKMTDQELAMVKAAASQSSHPLSRLVAKSLANVQTGSQKPAHYLEASGSGIRASFGNQTVKLGSAAWAGEQNHGEAADNVAYDQHFSRVYVSINDISPGYFLIKVKYRENLQTTIGKLHDHGFNTYLLSGDKRTDQQYLAHLFGSNAHLYFKQKPEDKLAFIATLQEKMHQNVLMVGDGLNDAGALQQSNVGVAVSDDINNFTPSCDMIIEGRQLSRLPAFINLARHGQKIIKASFAISLIYNIGGLFFAIGGQLSPVLAAILMPVSLISIVGFTTIASNVAASRILKN
ncbi:heavy metal translocating P-type ATPase metal-binding domain-containing protein [Dyadobacter chenwenxiniae]|uniref:Heavy metal translocating P-type ATPase metal-binding domain-containing protein n=1 Tax=Dyadobacter chenwenxiniae TaxID=2906456 RepID=A0A9X1PJJ5_9BACT|nr:heavy metal translocating P-type ATPase metal-binding domain-containing protein [Dyadobacter chenwenxiniae]MCF0062602.1 heavy metal translocating P-type ATPase metal-binding domain-containing protein [Dyadobacter chenwenxiniae]UON83651.1 heavy metal translocating P-type ATPase metal-binding domain-containing protein [Dyadobacter chenwenxiniae]